MTQVLEQSLRNFSTLTKGDIISIKYNGNLFDILVMETKPEAKGISIVETDLSVDFAPPVGYVEPENPNKSYAVRVSFFWSSTTLTFAKIFRTKPRFLFKSILFAKSQILSRPSMVMEPVCQERPRLHFSKAPFIL